MSTTYKLHYFNLRARGELARMIFAAADQEYKDIRIDGQEWATVKPTMPNGQVPLLEIDGQKLTQSIAIYRYLANQFGFAGKSIIDQAFVDEVVCTVVDVLNVYIRFYFESNDTEKAKLRRKLIEETAPSALDFLTTLLEKNEKTTKGGNSYFVGDSLTIADMIVYDILETLEKMEASIVEKYRKLLAIRESVKSHEKLGKYLKSRPNSVI